MTSITIHNIEPETGEMIRRLAATQGLSLNQQVKRLLRKALGLTEQGEMPPRDFSEFSGVWTRKEAEAFDAATARSIDPEDWR